MPRVFKAAPVLLDFRIFDSGCCFDLVNLAVKEKAVPTFFLKTTDLPFPIFRSLTITRPHYCQTKSRNVVDSVQPLFFSPAKLPSARTVRAEQRSAQGLTNPAQHKQTFQRRGPWC